MLLPKAGRRVTALLHEAFDSSAAPQLYKTLETEVVEINEIIADVTLVLANSNLMTARMVDKNHRAVTLEGREGDLRLLAALWGMAEEGSARARQGRKEGGDTLDWALRGGTDRSARATWRRQSWRRHLSADPELNSYYDGQASIRSRQYGELPSTSQKNHH